MKLSVTNQTIAIELDQIVSYSPNWNKQQYIQWATVQTTKWHFFPKNRIFRWLNELSYTQKHHSIEYIEIIGKMNLCPFVQETGSPAVNKIFSTRVMTNDVMTAWTMD